MSKNEVKVKYFKNGHRIYSIENKTYMVLEKSEIDEELQKRIEKTKNKGDK